MARDQAIEARLKRWAAACTIGDGSGYPTLNVLHRSWMPPSGGSTPTLKVGAASDVMQTHIAVDQLSYKLHHAVVVHYCKRGPIATQCAELECVESTLYARIDAAHVRLRELLPVGGFCNKEEVR